MECIFCKIAKKEIEATIVFENDELLAFLDNDPINEGHILIIPKQHFLDIDEIPKKLACDIMELSQKIVKTIKTIYSPDGYSIMQNGGEFNDIGHFHFHIFPRYKNDGFDWICAEKQPRHNKEIADKIRLYIK